MPARDFFVATNSFNPGPSLPIPTDVTSTSKHDDSLTLDRQSVQLNEGCYLLNYTPAGLPASKFSITFDGTFRVFQIKRKLTASGDLYARAGFFRTTGPNPAAGIPIFARSRYRFYLRVISVKDNLEFNKTIGLTLELWRFSGLSAATWTEEGTFTAQLEIRRTPSDYPIGANYYEGDVTDLNGVVIARLSMGWISPFLRKATIEIDRVSQSEAALDNGDGVDWKTVGATVGWQIQVDESDSDVDEPSGQSWSDAEVHEALLNRRDTTDLDAEWRYHCMAVRRLDSTARGIMYDAFGGDSNNVPREGFAVSSHWSIPSAPMWGSVQGDRFGNAAAPYFRTAVHELGHAMGLYHNTINNGFLNTTPAIAQSSLEVGSPQFPENVLWQFAPDDDVRLRHMPDIYVRPGGVPFGTAYATTPISPADTEVQIDGLELVATAHLDSVPLGAPVRVDVSVKNTTQESIVIPASLKLKDGHLSGAVVDPAGTSRSFTGVIRHVDDESSSKLKPGKKVSHSMTLLRGHEGALFPMPGLYNIEVNLRWEVEGRVAVVSGNTAVIVTGAVNDAHARAALSVLTTPDTLLVLAIGGDHLKAGIAAIDAALTDPILKPHFAYIEAKRLAERFGKRKAKKARAAKLIKKSTVMSDSEKLKAKKWRQK